VADEEGGLARLEGPVQPGEVPALGEGALRRGRRGG